MKIAILVFLISGRVFAAESGTDLADVISSAEKMNQGLTASQIQERISTEHVSINKGAYLPSLEFDAIDSPGFPGSGSSMGIGGIMGSPYRAGYSAGLLASGTLWDFGRTTAAVQAAEHDANADKAETDVERGQIDRGAVDLFVECVRYKSQMESWDLIFKDTAQVDHEVQNFVFTGQRSVVDKYLSKTQVEQAFTAKEDYRARLDLTQKRIQILTGIPLEQIQCPDIDSLSGQTISEFVLPDTNPVISRDQERVQAALSRKDRAWADFMPKLKGFASVGMMENAHIIDKQDYGVGLGFQVPLFDGFRTVNGVHESAAEAEKSRSLLDNSRYQIDLANARFDELIESAQARLKNLGTESDTTQSAYEVAKKRYFSIQGSLVDLREAIRNVASLRSEIVDAKAGLWYAQLEKIIFNGGRIKNSQKEN